MEKVYLVIGTIWSGDSFEPFAYTVVNDNFVHATMKGARSKLYFILDEANRKAKENGITFEARMKKERLEIIWTETGTEEHWDIHCCEVDKRI